jgi:hypothetical protein
VTKTRQSDDPEGGRIHPSTAPHWCTASAALEELGWPWLRLCDELLARRLFYRTYPPGHEIDWGDPTLQFDRAESAVTILDRHPAKTAGVINFYKTVAVEVLLPVGQRPPLIKASWRDRVPEAELKSAMEDIAKSYDGKPPPTENDVWSKLKDRFGLDFPRDAARGALKTYAPQLKRAPGETSKVKSRS